MDLQQICRNFVQGYRLDANNAAHTMRNYHEYQAILWAGYAETLEQAIKEAHVTTKIKV
jgi:hypothetical protein